MISLNKLIPINSEITEGFLIPVLCQAKNQNVGAVFLRILAMLD